MKHSQNINIYLMFICIANYFDEHFKSHLVNSFFSIFFINLKACPSNQTLFGHFHELWKFYQQILWHLIWIYKILVEILINNAPINFCLYSHCWWFFIEILMTSPWVFIFSHGNCQLADNHQKKNFSRQIWSLSLVKV